MTRLAASKPEQQPAFPAAPPSVAAVKHGIRGGDVSRSTSAGLALAVADGALYVALIAGVILLQSWAAKLACSVAAGLNIAVLFVVAHDACHGSCTPSPRLNAAIGRLCFLPSFFPFSPWEHGHNRLHHGWTNLKERDYVWRPFSLEEYRALPAWRRGLERIYRTTPGVALYTIIAIWWTHMIRLRAEDRRAIAVRVRRLDRLLVVVYGMSVVVVVWPSGTATAALAIVLPWLVFHWLLGIVTLMHHTHPRGRWFRTREEWSFFGGQVASTIHMQLPKVVDLVLHNIVVHGAHHVDPKIPLYRLEGAQSRLEAAFGPDMIVERWSLRSHCDLLRCCKLYDYEHHRWLGFDGVPTMPRRP